MVNSTGAEMFSFPVIDNNGEWEQDNIKKYTSFREASTYAKELRDSGVLAFVSVTGDNYDIYTVMKLCPKTELSESEKAKIIFIFEKMESQLLEGTKDGNK